MTFNNNAQAINGVANGAISAFRFVRFDDGDSAAVARSVKQAGANQRVVGVGPEYDVATGEGLHYYASGIAQVMLGGSVTQGDAVKSDANGKAVILAVGGVTPQHVAGIAKNTGVSGDIITVQIEIYTVQPGDYLS